MVLPNQVCLIVKLYNNRPELLPDSNDAILLVFLQFTKSIAQKMHYFMQYKVIYLPIIRLPMNILKRFSARAVWEKEKCSARHLKKRVTKKS